jgi:hypothetical protein
MSQNNLEKRVAALEEQVRWLMLGKRSNPGREDWLATVGMFTGDEYMKKIDAAALEFREKDRRRARRAGTKKRLRRAKS